MRIRSSLPTDNNGNALHDPLSYFYISNGPTEAEQDDDIKYYLGIAHDGSWYIRRSIYSTGTERFCRGYVDYVGAWANKAIQAYDYFDEIF